MNITKFLDCKTKGTGHSFCPRQTLGWNIAKQWEGSIKKGMVNEREKCFRKGRGEGKAE